MTKVCSSVPNKREGTSGISGTLLFIVIVFSVLLLFLISLRKSSSYSGDHMMSYHVRGKLARTLYNKMMEDENDTNTSHDHWYALKINKLPSDLCDKFLQSHHDTASKAFLHTCKEKSDSLFTQMYQGVVSTLLSAFMTQTSINGLLRRGSMFVLSTEQFLNLLNVEDTWQSHRLLDLGAGDGEVTRQMAGHFEEVYVTEMSTTMLWRLKEKGYVPLGLTEWNDGSRQYDVISCLNVLDRCDKPLTLVEDMRKSLVPKTGRLVIAMVLPYSPYVEFKHRNHQPAEKIPVQGTTFEEQTTSLIKDFFEPAGFTVDKFTRVPYLCEGDLEHSYYVLHDVVFVLSVKDGS